MTAKGHMVVSVPVGYMGLFLTSKYVLEDFVLDSRLIILYSFFVLLGSVFPDIDEPESFIGRRLPIFSNVLSIFISHRGITHFLIIPLGILLLAYYEDDLNIKFALLGFAIGILAHDIGDMLTKGGIIGFLFPFFMSKKIALLPEPLRFITGSITEYIVIFSILCGIFYSLFISKTSFFLL